MSSLKKYRFDGSNEFKISKVSTNSKKDNVSKKDILKKTEKNQAKIFALQDKLYADGKEGLIVILQARDAAGKDSTIRHVMAGVNPQGVSVYSYKQPSKEELAHDYLWRCHKNLPQRGMIAIFNRSYYEDVLVVKVDKLYENFNMAKRCLDPRDFIAKRLKQIRHYEDYLYDNSYRVVKIFLNVSKKKQKERFLERINTDEKNWKFSSSDIQVRERWEEYDEAYESCINETATKDCPWYVIPADQKWYSRYLVSEAILEALEAIDPQYPVLPDEEKAKLAECKYKLENEPKKAAAVEQEDIKQAPAEQNPVQEAPVEDEVVDEATVQNIENIDKPEVADTCESIDDNESETIVTEPIATIVAEPIETENEAVEYDDVDALKANLELEEPVKDDFEEPVEDEFEEPAEDEFEESSEDELEESINDEFDSDFFEVPEKINQ